VALLAAVEVEAFEERARQAFEWQTALAGMPVQVSKGLASKIRCRKPPVQTPESIKDRCHLEIGVPRARSGSLVPIPSFRLYYLCRPRLRSHGLSVFSFTFLYDRLNLFVTIVCLSSTFQRRHA
jgi:hypothetical protein